MSEVNIVDDGMIYINDYISFDVECGWFRLSDMAQNILYREKEIICSYSGSVEWGHMFFCELLNLYSGDSTYNYALGTVNYASSIKKLYEEGHQKEVADWVERKKNEVWFTKAAAMLANIIRDLPRC